LISVSKSDLLLII